jgi:hypothetical protein
MRFFREGRLDVDVRQDIRWHLSCSAMRHVS